MTSGRTDTGIVTQTPGTETAVLAGGCFWGMEDLIRRQHNQRQALSHRSRRPAPSPRQDRKSVV